MPHSTYVEYACHTSVCMPHCEVAEDLEIKAALIGSSLLCVTFAPRDSWSSEVLISWSKVKRGIAQPHSRRNNAKPQIWMKSFRTIRKKLLSLLSVKFNK